MTNPGFAGVPEDAFRFFVDIRFNNHRAFFEENRKRYEQSVKQPFFALAEALAPAIGRVDERLDTRPRRVVSRIRRDTRFTKDKTPYRDHVWLSWRQSQEGNGECFGVYFEIDEMHYGYGAGFYGNNREGMAAFREKLRNPAQAEAFLRIAGRLDRAGFLLGGEDYKRIPEGCPQPELLPWYIKKGFYVYRDVPLAEGSVGPELVDELAAAYEKLGPLYRFMYTA
ncbi:MAG: DUF2461 domain-containing protein [Christensenellales bacterium]